MLSYSRASFVCLYSNYFGANFLSEKPSSSKVISSQNVLWKDSSNYRDLYKHLDHKSNGVKVCDIVNNARKLGLTATEEEIENLFESLHLQSYGVMSEEEFVVFISKLKSTPFDTLDVETYTKEKSQNEDKSWWSERVIAVKAESAHCKRGFVLLFEQLKFACKRIMYIIEGRNLSRYESQKVLRAARDLLILIPVATLAVLPGGGVAVAFLVKCFPQFLPSTFRLENMTRQRKNEIVITEVTAVIEEMEN